MQKKYKESNISVVRSYEHTLINESVRLKVSVRRLEILFKHIDKYMDFHLRRINVFYFKEKPKINRLESKDSLVNNTTFAFDWPKTNH